MVESEQIYRKLVIYLKERNLFYKPHPSSSITDYTLDIEHIQIFKGDFKKALKKFDVFISFSSTCLFEANLHTLEKRSPPGS